MLQNYINLLLKTPDEHKISSKVNKKRDVNVNNNNKL